MASCSFEKLKRQGERSETHRTRSKIWREGADFACSSLALVCLVPELHTLIREACLESAHREPVELELLEAATLEGMADDGDARRVGACELAEVGDREEQYWYELRTACLVVARGNQLADGRNLV